jgi:hypothetical protein
MKVYVIDPHAQTVTGEEHDGSLDSLHRLAHCECVDLVRINELDDGIFVDDEGLLHDLAKQAFFVWRGYDSPLAGYGVVTGCDEEGATVAPRITLKEVRENVRFVTLDRIRRNM